MFFRLSKLLHLHNKCKMVSWFVFGSFLQVPEPVEVQAEGRAGAVVLLRTVDAVLLLLVAEAELVRNILCLILLV